MTLPPVGGAVLDRSCALPAHLTTATLSLGVVYYTATTRKIQTLLMTVIKNESKFDSSSRVNSMIQTGCACCSEKKIMSQFTVPWKVFKVKLTN